MQPRRIRISFSDPDATDSDSGDDASSSATSRSMKQATGKTEIVILVGNNMVLAGSSNADRGSKARAAGSPAASSGKNLRVKAERRYRGVYERQPGRWAAEFRSHRLKVRRWIGTFRTEEEAKAAYDAFQAQCLSLPTGVALPAPDRVVHKASLPPADEKRPVVLALKATTVTTAMKPSAREPSVSSTPCISSLTTRASPLPASQDDAQPPADALASIDPLFLDVESTEEELVGLADLKDLPLPCLDDNFDHLLSLGDLDLSLFDIGFL